jgi:predicted ATPase
LPLQCSPVHQYSSLHPVKEYLDWVSGVHADDPPDTRRDKLRRLFQSPWGSSEEQTAILMDVVASSGTSEQEANADIGVLLKRRMAFQILAEKVFSTALPGRPLCVLFEDVHWIDPTSAEFLLMLINRAPEHAVLVLTTTRPEGIFSARMSDLGVVIPVERLREAEAMELAMAACQAAGLGGDILDVIIEKSEGIPLFVEEYAQMLSDSAAAQKNLGSAAQLRSIPLTLSGLVQAKIDRPNPHAQKIARIGSALGRTFEVEMAQELSALDGEACRKAIEALEAADLAHLDSSMGGRGTVTFKHALVQDAIYSSLSSHERRRWHSAVADALMADGDPRRVAAEMVAEHLLQASRYPESAEWRLSAARAAAGEGSAAEALAQVRFGLKAVEAMPEGPDRDRLELQLRAIEGPDTRVGVAAQAGQSGKSGACHLQYGPPRLGLREACRCGEDRRRDFRDIGSRAFGRCLPCCPHYARACRVDRPPWGGPV